MAPECTMIMDNVIQGTRHTVVAEVPGWFELRSDDRLNVWQSVLALRNKNGDVWLMKINKNLKCKSKVVDIIKLNRLLDQSLKKSKLTSNGYWTCAEVTGLLKSRRGFDHSYEIYYHCANTEEGHVTLTYARRFAEMLSKTKLFWNFVNLKADMNPFRNLSYHEAFERKRKWSAMFQHCSISNFTITEADMLIYDYD